MRSGITPLYAVVDVQWAPKAWYPQPSVDQQKTRYLELMELLIAKGAKNFARRWVFDKLHRRGIETADLPCQIERLASYPDVGAYAQGGLGFPHAAAQRKRQRQACENAQLSSGAHMDVHSILTLRPVRKDSPRFLWS